MFFFSHKTLGCCLIGHLYIYCRHLLLTIEIISLSLSWWLESPRLRVLVQRSSSRRSWRRARRGSWRRRRTRAWRRWPGLLPHWSSSIAARLTAFNHRDHSHQPLERGFEKRSNKNVSIAKKCVFKICHEFLVRFEPDLQVLLIRVYVPNVLFAGKHGERGGFWPTQPTPGQRSQELHSNG